MDSYCIASYRILKDFTQNGGARMKKFAFSIKNKDVFMTVITWLTSFALSNVIQAFGWTDQGTAFIWLYCLIIAVRIGFMFPRLFRMSGINTALTIVGAMISMYVIVFLLTWAFEVIFEVSFSTVFQILTFGQVMATGKE